ncbi:MAG: LysM peptidoglycan-binding domain-containing protein [Betaproteobacteria bacterium]
MRNSITTATVGLMLVLCQALPLRAEDQPPLELTDNPPKRYVVVKGDTLWGISKRYLKSPWRWPDLWGMNKEEVRNPHLIYPGNVLILDLSGPTPRLRMEGDGGLAAAGGDSSIGSTVKLSPRVRVDRFNTGVAISSISPSAIEPFMNRPLIVDASQFETSPRVVSMSENRVVSAAGDSMYVRGIEDGGKTRWQVYRPGKTIVDPITREVLGSEAVYLGDAQLREYGEDISIVDISRARLEITTGDRLVETPAPQLLTYMPRSPARDLVGMVVSTQDNVLAEVGQRQVVVLNVGSRNGVEMGHVFALYRSGATVTPRALPRSASNEDARRSLQSVYKDLDPKGKSGPVKLPDTRYGLVFVFRTFEKVSYALVLNATMPVNLRDLVRAP